MHNAIDMHLSLQIDSFSHSTLRAASSPFVWVEQFFQYAFLQSVKYFRRKYVELLKLCVPLDLSRSCLHIFNHFCPHWIGCIHSVPAAYVKFETIQKPQLISSHLIFCLYFIGVSCRPATHAYYSILKAIFMWYFVYILKSEDGLFVCIFITICESRANENGYKNLSTISVADR